MKPLRAFNLPLKELESAVFFKAKEEYSPHYAITEKGQRVSRIGVWGVVTRTFESENGFASISLDDFTGTIDVNAFKDDMELFSKIKKGDSVKVIGKVRENNNGLYVLAEGVKRLSFKEELLQRARNIEAYKKIPVKAKEKKEKVNETEFLQASELSIDRKVIE